MPETRYFILADGLAAFGIARFDRQDGLRVPMHTLAGAAQADFRIPSMSYLTMLRMTKLMTQSDADVLKAYRRCVFNVVFNNRDDHSKNFSYLMTADGRWQLAPGYDLTYCAGPGGEHQMDIEGEGRAPTRAHLLKLATSAGLNIATCSRVIDEVAEQGLRFEKLAKQHPISAAMRKEVGTAIAGNLGRLR